MNKQELIDKWESKTGAPSYEISDFSINPSKNDMYIAVYGVARTEIIKDLKQLDEPQKPVVPKFVANLVDWTIKMQCAPSDVIRDLHDNGDLANLPRDLELDKLSEYFDKAYCRYNFEKACFVGYEIEKLYEVIIGDLYLIKKFNDRNDFCFDTSRSLCTWEKSAYQLTEAEIKAIDERFWAFAVPVEEVAEG
ncbi:DUF1642 domain-containing protein [Enterococcus hirae]|nr:DUF1642 domain-containing protein [Enterococcus hirae]